VQLELTQISPSPGPGMATPPGATTQPDPEGAGPNSVPSRGSQMQIGPCVLTGVAATTGTRAKKQKKKTGQATKSICLFIGIRSMGRSRCGLEGVTGQGVQSSGRILGASLGCEHQSRGPRTLSGAESGVEGRQRRASPRMAGSSEDLFDPTRFVSFWQGGLTVHRSFAVGGVA